MDDPLFFFDENLPYFEFSNFSPHGFLIEGVYWPTVEHYFQAQKFTDDAYRKKIRTAATPEQAKRLGRSRDRPLPPDWDRVKEAVMKRALRAKFADPALAALLLDTGERPLIEKSERDSYWGCGPDGAGKNRAGHLLMEVRTELRLAKR